MCVLWPMTWTLLLQAFLPCLPFPKHTTVCYVENIVLPAHFNFLNPNTWDLEIMYSLCLVRFISATDIVKWVPIRTLCN
jgi:hypothetical protein